MDSESSGERLIPGPGTGRVLPFSSTRRLGAAGRSGIDEVLGAGAFREGLVTAGFSVSGPESTTPSSGEMINIPNRNEHSSSASQTAAIRMRDGRFGDAVRRMGVGLVTLIDLAGRG